MLIAFETLFKTISIFFLAFILFNFGVESKDNLLLVRLRLHLHDIVQVVVFALFIHFIIALVVFIDTLLVILSVREIKDSILTFLFISLVGFFLLLNLSLIVCLIHFERILIHHRLSPSTLMVP